MYMKKHRGRNTEIRQNRLKRRAINRDTEVHLIIIKGRIHQEDINMVNIYAPIIRALKYMYENL